MRVLLHRLKRTVKPLQSRQEINAREVRLGNDSIFALGHELLSDMESIGTVQHRSVV
jgi:hypothetical protein